MLLQKPISRGKIEHSIIAILHRDGSVMVRVVWCHISTLCVYNYSIANEDCNSQLTPE